MIAEELDWVWNQIVTQARTIELGKRPAYTSGASDVLVNFKRAATRVGITPLQAWGVHLAKQLDTIFTYATDPSIPQAEPMASRFADVYNYLKLGWGLMNDGYSAGSTGSGLEDGSAEAVRGETEDLGGPR